jgi:hypothetical protein
MNFEEGTVTNAADVATGAASAEALAANPARRYLRIQNTGGTNPCRVGLGITPTSTRGILLAVGASFELRASDGPMFCGAVNVIQVTGASTVSVVEIVAKVYS